MLGPRWMNPVCVPSQSCESFKAGPAWAPVGRARGRGGGVPDRWANSDPAIMSEIREVRGNLGPNTRHESRLRHRAGAIGSA